MKQVLLSKMKTLSLRPQMTLLWATVRRHVFWWLLEGKFIRLCDRRVQRCRLLRGECGVIPVCFSSALDIAIRTPVSTVSCAQHIRVIHVVPVFDYIPHGEFVRLVETNDWEEKAAFALVSTQRINLSSFAFAWAN
jgi:hypothetical protein